MLNVKSHVIVKPSSFIQNYSDSPPSGATEPRNVVHFLLLSALASCCLWIIGVGHSQEVRRKVKLAHGQLCCKVALWPLALAYIKTLSWNSFMGSLESPYHLQCWEPQQYSSIDIGDDAFSSHGFLIPSM